MNPEPNRSAATSAAPIDTLPFPDGREDGRIEGKGISLRPEFVLISTEPQGYRHENHEPTPEARAAVGDTFLVDYVRVFDIVD